MSSINGFDSNSMNTLFASLGTTSTDTSASGMMGINLNDYASIKNGSYSKLVKAYYAQEKEDVKTDSKNDTDDTDQTLKEIKNTTADLKESAQALYASKGLFAQNADGEYDMEAIYEKVNAFLEDYNAAVDSVGSAETESIARAGASMVNAANNYSDMFDKLGISINSVDFSLSVDKEKFMKSNISDIKSMFSGVGSFAYQIGAKASRINTLVAEKVPTSGSYVSGKKDAATSSTSKDTANTIAKVKDYANSLNAIGTDLYKSRTVFDMDGGKYDVEKILDEVGSFVEAYNDLLISSENSKSSGITNAVTSMTDIAKDYTDKLSKVGITFDKEDNTIILNEDLFKQANMYNVEKLFSGTASFAYKISVKAAMVANQADTEANKSNTYTGDGVYSNNHNTGSILDGLV